MLGKFVTATYQRVWFHWNVCETSFIVGQKPQFGCRSSENV